MPQSCSEVNTSASTSGAGKRFLHVYPPHCVGRQTPSEDGGGEQISVSLASPTSEQGCVLHEASRALKPLFSNSASEEGRKSDVTPVCFQTSSPPKHTNTHKHYLQSNDFHDGSNCSLLSHYWDVLRPYRALKHPIRAVFVFVTSNSECQGGNGARWMFVFPSKVYSYYVNLVQRTKLIYFSFAITWASRAEQALVFVSCRGVCWEKSEAISWMCERQ